MSYSAGIIKAKEETEARTVFGSTDAGDVDSPAYQCLSYREQMLDVRLSRMVYGGTKTMRAAKKDVLPIHPMEQPDKYEARVKIAVAENALAETVEALAGMVFRKNPTYSDDTPEMVQGSETVAGWVSDIDLQGNALPVFARNVAENALADGHTWLHIESPRPDPTVRSRSEEQARPYWINVLKSQARNWAYEMRGGRPVLTLFVYDEAGVEPDGAFGERRVERIRVLREKSPGVVRGELWEMQDDAKDKKRWVRIGEYPIDAPAIPVVCVYAKRTGIFESAPPLLDLAYEQIEHFRVRSERQKALTFAGVAVPYVFGAQVTDAKGKSKVTWAHDGVMLINDPETNAGVIESSGNGLAALSEELVAIEGRMAKPGIKMLRRPEGVQPNTATAEILQKAQGEATLAVFAIRLEDALNSALDFTAGYRSDMESAGTVALNRDFHEKLLSPEHIRVLLEAADRGKLTTETFLRILRDGEVLPDHVDVDEELERLASDGADEIAEAIRRIREAVSSTEDGGGDEAGAEAA